MQHEWLRVVVALVIPGVLAGQSAAAPLVEPVLPETQTGQVARAAGPSADGLRVGVQRAAQASDDAPGFTVPAMVHAPSREPPKELAPTLAAVGGVLGGLVGFLGAQLAGGQNVAVGVGGGIAVGAFLGYALGGVLDDARKVPVR